MKIRKFEDLESWKKARKLTNTVYEATGTGSFTRDFGLKDQIRRASISILSNIAEGFERGGDKEFLQFLAVAKGIVWRGSRTTLHCCGSRVSIARLVREIIQRCR